MAYSISKQSGHVAYELKEFTCDTPEDVQILPLDCKPGSTAFIISNSSVYMLNNQYEWVAI